jgi:hypothetical protein
MWAAVTIARILASLGYETDVLDWTDYHTRVSGDYDVLIGMGRAAQVARDLPASALKICLTTGTERALAVAREQERCREIEARRGMTVRPRRHDGTSSSVMRFFDVQACIGNEVTAATYRSYFDGPVMLWDNHGYDDAILKQPTGRDHEAARRRFLFVASLGLALCGLDIVLEAFRRMPELELHVVCSLASEPDFAECYAAELFDTPNITAHGRLAVDSYEFRALALKTCAVVHPACAGASPGAVTGQMNFGLIPVISREAGIDVDGFGVFLEALTPEAVMAACTRLSRQSPAWHEEMEARVLAASAGRFSQAAFRRRWTFVISESLRRKQAGELRPVVLPSVTGSCGCADG